MRISSTVRTPAIPLPSTTSRRRGGDPLGEPRLAQTAVKRGYRLAYDPGSAPERCADRES